VSILSLYGRTAALATRRAVRGWPVLLSFPLYGILLVLGLRLFGGAGFVGGIVISALSVACWSSYLHLLSNVVAGRPFKPRDLVESFGARFWDVMSVFFAFWIIDFVLGRLAAGAGDKGDIVLALAHLAMAVFFNPTVELLYQSHARSFSLLSESARFISRYGLEWLVPNISLALGVLALLGLVRGQAPGAIVLEVSTVLFPLVQGPSTAALFTHLFAQGWIVWLLLLLLIHWIMVFRGLLFSSLNGRVPRGPGWTGLGRR
jgi:hypothetical protein